MRRSILVLLVAVVVVAAGCSAGVLELEVGECFDDPPDFAAVEDVPITDCASPHDNEVIALFDITAEAFPGDDAVGTQADAGCRERFEAYVGERYLLSPLAVGWLAPTSESWRTGDRQVICFAFDPGGPLVGTVRGGVTEQ
jgi:Septum formation